MILLVNYFFGRSLVRSKEMRMGCGIKNKAIFTFAAQLSWLLG